MTLINVTKSCLKTFIRYWQNSLLSVKNKIESLLICKNKSMKKYIFPLVLIFLSSCNPWKYVAEFDHKADFDTYKTFGLLNWDPQNDKVISPQTKKYILLSIKDELEARGYTYEENGADLQVSVFAIVQQETNYAAYSDHYAGYYGPIGVGVGVGSGGVGVGVVGYGFGTYPYTIYKNDYEVGTVVIDLLDNSKKIIVWQGVASGRLSREEATEGSVRQSLRKLFSDFPKKRVKK
ncbi:MAG: hypothetical protein DRI72_04170 [Bacteroidetes bacterium]|nr:MAG: hypothetical protein DRI72_04170 [Bacteroidota bacterium]